jgi:hypothetical protein
MIYVILAVIAFVAVIAVVALATNGFGKRWVDHRHYHRKNLSRR